MSAATSIEWTDVTWNPVRGCSRVSAGCDNCYAMRQAHRQSGEGGAYEGLTRIGARGVDWSGKVRLVPELLDAPLRWRKPRRVFVNSMSDLFHESLRPHQVAAIFGIMAASPQHTFQVLTKRPERMREWFVAIADAPRATMAMALANQILDYPRALQLPAAWPLPNVWLGVSCEDQATADERIPLLLQTPAAVRFVSAEPLLGEIDISAWTWGRNVPCSACPGDVDCECGFRTRRENGGPTLDWVIVGGESGPRARSCDVQWIRSLVGQCKAAAVPVFVKQLGERPLDWSRAEPTGAFRTDPETGRRQMQLTQARLRDRKGGDPSEWPKDLRVREFPAVRP